MANRLNVGSIIPEFKYDTPYQPQKSFYALLQARAPLFLIFLSNFGHPVTRTYLAGYSKTIRSLHRGNLAVVVRSRPDVIAAAIPKGSLPFELICDAEGVLYRYFDIPQEKNPMKYASLNVRNILKEAQKAGYVIPKDAPQQLPLSLVLDSRAEVQLCHYGKTLGDIPEDCRAMERTLGILPQGRMPEQSEPTPAPPRTQGSPQPAPGKMAMRLDGVKVWDANDEPWHASEHLPPEEKARKKQEEKARPAKEDGWEDNTQEILLDFQNAARDESKLPKDSRYNTTGEIDIIGVLSGKVPLEKSGKKQRRENKEDTLEKTLMDFDEIKF